MTIKAVTFDFHNTIATCDRQFALEVRDLATQVLQRLAEQGLHTPDLAASAQAHAAYRSLRAAIMVSGEDQDALACTLHALAAAKVVVSAASVTLAIDALMNEAMEDVALVPGIREAVHALRAGGLLCGVVSSAIHQPFLEWTLDHFELRGAFATIVTSASCGFYKTRPEIYAIALSHLGVTPTEAIHVGDSYRFDVQGARRAGMRTIWFASTEIAIAAPDNEADATISDLTTLPTVIATLDGTGTSSSVRRWWRR